MINRHTYHTEHIYQIQDVEENANPGNVITLEQQVHSVHGNSTNEHQVVQNAQGNSSSNFNNNTISTNANLHPSTNSSNSLQYEANNFMHFQQIVENNYDDDEESEEINQNGDLLEQYYNYNELLNPLINQGQLEMTLETIMENLRAMFINEKEFIKSESELIRKQTKYFNNVKDSFNKQNLDKQKELKKLLYCENEIIEEKKEEEETDMNNSFNDSDTIELELANNKTINVKRGLLTKYPNSILGACFNGHISIPKRDNKYFMDRDSKSFLMMLHYLKTNKLPKFTEENEEKIFFDELNFWGVPVSQSKHSVKFDINWCPNFFHIDKTQKILTSSDLLSGIAFIKRTLTATNSYFEFTFSVIKEHSNNNNKIIIALVDPSKFKKNYLFSSFESGVPFYFYWDPFNLKAAKYIEDGSGCKFFNIGKVNCFKQNAKVITFGIKYVHDKRAVELFIDGHNLGLLFKGINPGLTPAIEIKMEECKIQLNNINEPQEKFFL